MPHTLAESTGTFDAWGKSFQGCTSENGSVVLDSSTSRRGNYSAKASFKLPYQSNRYLNFYTIVKGLKKNAKYKCGLSVKAKDAGSVIVSFGWKERHVITPLGKTFDWIDLSYNFTNTYGFTNMDFLLVIESITKAIWFDDVFVREVRDDGTLGPNLVENSSFEKGDDEVAETDNEQVNGLYTLYRDIESRDSFSLDEIKQVLGAFKYAPVYKAEGIEIDGRLEDWAGYPKFGLPTKPDQYQIYKAGSEKDVDAYCQYAYDDESFCLAIHVKDDIFFEDPDLSKYWNGDSIQLAICDVGQSYGVEIGFAHHKGTGVGTVHSNILGADSLTAIDLKTVQMGKETVYEAKIPWNMIYKDGVLPPGFLFDIIVNDNDGKGRAYCVELAPGIAEGKNSAEFPYLEFVTDKKDCFAWIQGPKTVTENTETEYSFYLVNEGEAKTVTISSENSENDETVELPAHSGIRRTLKPKFSGHGKRKYIVTASYGEEAINASFDISVQPGLDSFDAKFTEMDAMAQELKAMLDECSKNGISTDYELVNYTVIERFCKLIREDFEANEYERAFYFYDSCKKLYDEAMEACRAYLAGERKPQPVTRFKTGEVTIDGPMVYATTETDGVAAKRPFFFTGYGHFENSIGPDLPVFQNFGVNIVQLSMDPAWNVISPTNDSNMFKFNYDTGIVTRMKKYLKIAEENNVQICILPGIHDLGDSIRKAYPQLVGKSVANVVVQQGDIKLHPIMKKLIDVHIKGILDTVGDSPALNSICLTNEPTNNCNSDYYQPYWAQYLTELYKADISKLNEAYGTDYKGFLEVPMPESASNTRWFYDYKQFNDNVLTEFHKYIAERIREINPDIKLHVKMMSMSRESEKSRNFLTYGTDHELMLPYSDYNGNDCYGCLYNSAGWNLLEGMEFYDMQMGMKKAPIFNSEDHIIADADDDYGPLQADFVETSQWQGYMHGKAASTVWSWDRSYDRSSAFYGTIDCRPDAIAKIGRTNFDANRLAYEIESIIRKEPTIAMITSTNARVFSLAYMSSMFKFYTNCLYNGQKVRFIPESQMDQLKNYKALVLTNIYNVKPETLEAIKEYADNGGKIVMLGEDCLKYDQYNEPHPSETVEAIKAKAQLIPTTDDSLRVTTPDDDGFFNLAAGLAKEINEDNVYIIDSKTGERVRDVEFEYANYNGNIVLNMANYSYDEQPKKVKIYVNGKQAADIYDLRRDAQMGSEIELKRYQPVFVRLGSSFTSAPAEKELKVFIDGEEYKFTEAKPFIDQNDRTLVPIRFIAEALDSEVDWIDETVHIKRGGDYIKYKPGDYYALYNDEKKDFDTFGIIKDERVFVPVRYIAELLSAKVEWDADAFSVLIESAQQ